jgi:hypothetical protein
MTSPYIVKAYNYPIVKDGSSTAPTLQKLYEHFEEVSTLWKIDAGSSSNDPSKSFTIIPRYGLQFQINFRRFDSVDNRVNVTIDPDCLITNSESGLGGDEQALPNTAGPKSFNNNFAFFWPESDFVGNGLWLIELHNAIFILNKVTNTRSKYGLHLGRVFTPAFESDPENGVEGFGILGNTISRSDSSEFNVPIGGYGLEPVEYRTLKVSNSPAHLTTAIRIREPGQFDDSSWGMGGRNQPDAYILSTYNIDINQCREIGFAKYFHRCPFSIPSGSTLIDKVDSSDQAFLYNRSEGDGRGLNGLLIPWEKGVSTF